jgi:hypothetical protein
LRPLPFVKCFIGNDSGRRITFETYNYIRIAIRVEWRLPIIDRGVVAAAKIEIPINGAGII